MQSLPAFPRLSANAIVSATCILALLHFGQNFLQPLALALILSLVIAPLIRMLSRTGLAHLPATLIAVTMGAVGIVGIGLVLAAQLVTVTGDLPQYSVAIQSKLEKVRELTERPFARIEADLKAVVPGAGRGSLVVNSAGAKLVAGQVRPIPVEIHVPQATATDTLTRLLSVVSGPIGEAGLVLVLMIFILLEHESLRDRIVRLTGNAEVGRTMRALGDATDGVSRFFFSQFVVNVVFGGVIGAGLWIAGVPHAALFGALSALLRFVPYLGALVAGAVIAIFVAAIDEGWSLAIYCVALYTALELLVANVVEPKVYGHSSGLSPLAVIVSALFWGALWGPVGLLISTPLTLCLVVTGRHVRALEPISILLSDAPIVDAAQRFYHRILLGESELIIRDALAYLRNFSFASYCDNVLLPGLALGVDEFDAGKIEKAQQNNIRSSIAALAATIIPAPGSVLKRPRRKVASGTDANVGAHLRQLRQMHLGRWQGSLDVPAGSVVLCAGLPSERDELLNELFVLALREAGVDARSASPENRDERPEGVDKLVAMVFLSYPLAQSLPEWQVMARQLRSKLPHAILVTLRLLSEGEDDKEAIVARDVDMVLHSFEEGVEFASPDRSG